MRFTTLADAVYDLRRMTVEDQFFGALADEIEKLLAEHRLRNFPTLNRYAREISFSPECDTQEVMFRLNEFFHPEKPDLKGAIIEKIEFLGPTKERPHFTVRAIVRR